MIGGIILIGVFIALCSLAVSTGISFGVCVVLNEIFLFLSKYINLQRVFLVLVFLGLTSFLYAAITDYILMIFE